MWDISGVELSQSDSNSPGFDAAKSDLSDIASLTGSGISEGNVPVGMKRQRDPTVFSPGKRLKSSQTAAENALSTFLDALGKAGLTAPVDYALISYVVPHHTNDHGMKCAYDGSVTYLLTLFRLL